MNVLTYFILITIIIIIIIYIFTDPIKTILLKKSDINLLNKYHNKLIEFQNRSLTRYPLGNDYFTIDRGNNYYSFYDRLGEINFGLCLYNNNIVATCCGIKRYIYMNCYSKQLSNVWYICDLKVDKYHRGKWLPYKILKKLGPKIGFSGKIYGVTMNSSKNDNKVLKLIKKIPLLNMKSGGILYIYSLDYKTMKIAEKIIKKYRGYLSYTSLRGIKDLILDSTNKPMDILHVNWLHNENINNEFSQPKREYTHMFCCHENDPMYYELLINNITTNITATIVHSNMDNSDWSFILTSDI